MDPAASAFIMDNLLASDEMVHGVLGVFPGDFPNARGGGLRHFCNVMNWCWLGSCGFARLKVIREES